jgi:hypothetical protein
MTCPAISADVRDRLRRPIDLDDVAIGIKQKQLWKTGRTIATHHDSHRIVLRCVFAKTIGYQSGESALEIVRAESKMIISAIDVARPKGAGRMKGQTHLQGAASEPCTGVLKRRPLDAREAQQFLIEGGRSPTMTLTWWSAS